jgi:exopolysaccharide biosynthesis polyprenyl glycosylphosphotransferase
LEGWQEASGMIRRSWRTILIFSAITIDIIAIVFSGFLAYFLRRYIVNIPNLPTDVFFYYGTFLGLVFLLFAMLLGVYRATLHSNSVRQYFLAAKAYLYAVLLSLAILYIFETGFFPRKFTLLFFLVLPFVFMIFRLTFSSFIRFMQAQGYGVHNVIIAGYDNGGMSIIKRFKNFPELGYAIKGIITNQKHQSLTPIEIHGTLVPKYPLHMLEHIVTEFNIDRTFVPSTDIITNGYAHVFDLCKKKNIKLKVLSVDSDYLLRHSHINDIAGITLYAPPRYKVDAIKRFMKRVFDLIAAGSLLIIVSPIFILTALSIWLESGYPIFFLQKRAAIKGGKTINFYKFRSMIKNADELKESLFDLNETDGALFKIKDDPRTTRVGKFIRRYSIDELPQLINVLKGEMSIVGPRPLPIGDLKKLKESKTYWNSIRDREKMKPGITGLWQISGRSKIGFREMIWLDLYYVENQSLLFDLEILFATIPVVLFGKGAY